MAFFSRVFSRCTKQQSNTFRQSAFTSNRSPSNAFLRPSSPSSSRSTSRIYQNLRQTRGYRFAGNEKPPNVPSYQPEHIYQTSNKIIWGLIGANVAVFGLMYFTPDQYRWLRHVVSNNAMLNLHAIQEHRYWTLLTSAFAHGSLFHLLGNMVSLYAFGNFVAAHPGVTPAHIITALVGSALTCSIASLVNAQAKGASPYFSFVGASGAVMGIGAVGAVLNPRAKFLIYGILPAPIWMLLGGFAFYDLYYLDDAASKIGHAGHLGGLAFGLVFALTRLRAFRYPL